MLPLSIQEKMQGNEDWMRIFVTLQWHIDNLKLISSQMYFLPSIMYCPGLLLCGTYRSDFNSCAVPYVVE